MTITITKWKLALAVLTVALLAPATAVATHIFSDVEDDKFYAEPVEWAFNNGITTGKSPTIFDPEGAVTRGESVTFLQRYDTNIVQPAVATLTSDVADNAAAIEALLVPVGYATVLDDGDVVEAQSSGVTDANVTLEVTSAFCFRDLPFTFTTVQASPLYEGTPNSATIEVGLDGAGFGTGDCAGTDAVLEIATQEDSSFAPHGFTVIFYK